MQAVRKAVKDFPRAAHPRVPNGITQSALPSHIKNPADEILDILPRTGLWGTPERANDDFRVLAKTQAFTAFYLPTPRITKIALNFLQLGPSHPLHHKVLRYYATADRHALWWSVIQPIIVGKVVVRRFQAKRLKSAIWLALQEKGYGPDGRLLNQTESGAGFQQLIQKLQGQKLQGQKLQGLEGTLRLTITKESLQVPTPVLRAEAVKLVEKIIRLQSRDKASFEAHQDEFNRPHRSTTPSSNGRSPKRMGHGVGEGRYAGFD